MPTVPIQTVTIECNKKFIPSSYEIFVTSLQSYCMVELMEHQQLEL